MSLFSTLARSAADMAAFVADDYHGNKKVAAVRREHDEWMRTARLHTPYYSLAPIFPANTNVVADYDVHGEYVFTGPAGLGLPNQLKCQGAGTSWRIWFQHGPLTLTPQQTHASYHARQAASHNAAMRSAAETVEAHALAELGRLYPASVGLLTGDRSI